MYERVVMKLILSFVVSFPVVEELGCGEGCVSGEENRLVGRAYHFWREINFPERCIFVWEMA